MATREGKCDSDKEPQTNVCPMHEEVSLVATNPLYHDSHVIAAKGTWLWNASRRISRGRHGT